MSDAIPRRRVVIFTASRFPADRNTLSTVEHIEAVAEAFPDWEFAVIHECPAPRRRSSFRAQVRRLIRHPIARSLDLLHRAATRPWRPARRSSCRPVGFPEALPGIEFKNVAYHRCECLGSPEAIRLVESLEPWLGLAVDAPVLKRSLFAVPRLGTINLQKSLLPRYRGLPPGFWELAEGARETGVSIHWVDEGLETGPLLLQVPLTIPPYSTPVGLAAELDLLGSRALVEALRRLEAGVADPAPRVQPPSRLYCRPDRRTVRMVRRRTRHRRPRPDRLRRLAKLIAFRTLLSTVIPLRNLVQSWRGRSHVTVLLFHRVSDAHHDSITVGVEQFRDILRLLKRRYEVLDLPEFLASRGNPRRRRAVALTFDDGYENNELAALLLRREGLPCTFFISTRIVGDADAAFPHDLEKLGRRIPALSWEQARRMARWGFHISNHTAHHVNLARVSPDEAAADIALAIDDLRRELGADIPGLRWLAYPYGLASDITAEVRGRLPGMGISHCFSAFGGSNGADFDVLDIRRQNLDCTFGPTQVLMAVEGWVVRIKAPRDRRNNGAPVELVVPSGSRDNSRVIG